MALVGLHAHVVGEPASVCAVHPLVADVLRVDERERIVSRRVLRQSKRSPDPLQRVLSLPRPLDAIGSILRNVREREIVRRQACPLRKRLRERLARKAPSLSRSEGEPAQAPPAQGCRHLPPITAGLASATVDAGGGAGNDTIRSIKGGRGDRLDTPAPGAADTQRHPCHRAGVRAATTRASHAGGAPGTTRSARRADSEHRDAARAHGRAASTAGCGPVTAPRCGSPCRGDAAARRKPPSRRRPTHRTSPRTGRATCARRPPHLRRPRPTGGDV